MSQNNNTVNMNSPPVAPAAVVLDEEGRTLSGSQYSSYPVATFVRDWVRTSFDHITERSTAVVSAGFVATTRTSADGELRVAEGDNSETLPLSVRSEADLPSDVLRRLRLPTTTSDVDSNPSSRSMIRSERDLDLHDEYILVDGALIVPPQAPNLAEQEMIEDMIRQQLQSNTALSKNCQPRKMRRGVRKFAKFFKRGGRKNNNNIKDESVGTFADHDSLLYEANNNSIETIVDSRNATQPEQVVEHVPPRHAAGISPSSASDENPNIAIGKRRSKKEKEKKQRTNWIRRLKQAPPYSGESGFSAHQDITTPLYEGNEEQLRRSALGDSSGVFATTGLEPPSTTTAEISRFSAAANAGGMDGLVSFSDDRLSLPPPLRSVQESPFGSGGRTTSVFASYVGTADQIQTSHEFDSLLLQDLSVAAESFIEGDLNDAAISKMDDSEPYLPISLVAEQADLKVDMADTPDVEALLRRAVIETITDLEAIPDSDCLPSNLPLPADHLAPGALSSVGLPKYEGKYDGISVPLSQATPHHLDVHNDTLKVVMVSASSVDKSWLARQLRGSNKRPRKRTTLAVDVHEWRPYIPSESATAHGEPDRSPVRCMIWDVQGASPTPSSTAESRSNFGAHPGTQSLFFSPQSLYLLCWDLGCNNPKTNRIESSGDLADDDSDFDADDDEYADDFIREEANRQADRALHADISNRVLSWFDCIALSGPKSAILPVALIPENMSEAEVQRRCEMMRVLLADHLHKAYDRDELAPKLLTGAENSILHVQNYGEGEGIQQLREMIAAIANDPSNSVFDHVGTPVPPGTVLVLQAIEKFKEEHKLILLDHLMGELGNALDVTVITGALHFLASIGEILYFGTNEDEVLTRYIILSRRWLISALSCILRNDLRRELVETRRFMNMQCLYSDQNYNENEITKALINGKSSSCPLLSDADAKMLWQSMSFMKEASDRYTNLAEYSTTIPKMFDFLERLLVRTGVFLPLGASQQNASLDQSEVFFVPSLLAQADPANMWTYMSGEGWMTTLCHSWLFRDGAPPNLMEYVTVRILRDLFEFSKTFPLSPSSPPREPVHRVHSVPVGKKSFDAFLEGHDTDAVGRVRIHHVNCFKSSMLVKIGTIFADHKTGDLRESFVEVFVAVVDQASSHSVASDVMRSYMQRVVVSGKGQAGLNGHKLWKGGYKLVLDSVRESFLNMANVDSQVICPECLATSSPRIASTWGWDVVLAAAESGHPHVICLRGHRVNSNLICGTCPDKKAAPIMDTNSSQRITKTLDIKEALPSVVLVGVWDPATKSVISVGSGFIADKKAGLIVTAGHVLFKMNGDSEDFGKPYFGHKNSRAVIAVIPDKEGKHAVFRYFAEIVAHDIHNVDACVLQIRARMETDVDDKVGVGAIDQPEHAIRLDKMLGEELRSLKMTKHFELAESVRLLGYNQGGEGIFEKGRHISPSVEYVEGNICRHFKATICEESLDSDSSSTVSQHPAAFAPREEIVVTCRAISGLSGGPCVNADGKVVGILSRSDPVERERCYLVPATEIKPLVTKAKSLCTSRPPIITSMQTI